MLVTDFLTLLRQQAKIGSSDLTDAELLSTANAEVTSSLVPLIRKVRTEYFVAETQVASYMGRAALPRRSVAGSVRHVQLVNGGGAVPLPMAQLEEDFLAGGSGIPSRWYFDGGSVVLLPRGTDGTVRFRYFLRPSKMAVATVVTVIAATQSAGGYTLTLSGAIVGPATLDVISDGGAHNACAIDVTNSGTTSLTVPASLLLAPIAIGDQVSSAGTTQLVPLPEELANALMHQTAAVLLRGMGYDSEAAAQLGFAETAIASCELLLAPRSEGNTMRRVGGIRGAIAQGGRFR